MKNKNLIKILTSIVESVLSRLQYLDYVKKLAEISTLIDAEAASFFVHKKEVNKLCVKLALVQWTLQDCHSIKPGYCGRGIYRPP